MVSRITPVLFAAAALVGSVPAQLMKGGTPPEFAFKKVWNDGPASFDELAGKVVLFDFSATW
jgi:hypothetical protein